MFYPKLFFWSLFCLSDVTYTYVFLLVVLCAIKGFDDGRYFYLMGVFIGIGYYTKGSGILLIPAVILFYFVRSWNIKAIFRDRAFMIAIGIAILLIMPFWIRNYIHFGNPLHSTQNNWSGNIGYSTDGPSNGNTYKVYWDKTRPTWTATKLPLGFSFIAKKSWEYFDTQFQWAFVNMGKNDPLTLKSALYFKPWRSVFRDFPKFLVGVPIGILGFPALLGLIFLWKDRNIYIIPIAFGIILLFLSITWAPIDRLILISVPLVISLGLTSYHRFLIWCLHYIPIKSDWLRVIVKGTPLLFSLQDQNPILKDRRPWRLPVSVLIWSNFPQIDLLAIFWIHIEGTIASVWLDTFHEDRRESWYIDNTHFTRHSGGVWCIVVFLCGMGGQPFRMGLKLPPRIAHQQRLPYTYLCRTRKLINVFPW